MTWRPDVTVAAVVERDGRFLLVEEDAEEGRRLNQPAGHWEPNETLLAAVVRETREESGYRFTPRALVGIYFWKSPANEATYLRFTFCGDVAERPLDDGRGRARFPSAPPRPPGHALGRGLSRRTPLPARPGRGAELTVVKRASHRPGRRSAMATNAVPRSRYAPSFRQLYQSERDRPALSPDRFIAELQEMAASRPFDAGLAERLRKGELRDEALRRWIKEYYYFVRLDAQGGAANVARCPRRGVYLDLAAGVARKSGFYQSGEWPVRQYQRFAEALGVSREELECHFACPETMQATYARLHHQFSSFEEGFAATYLVNEYALMLVARDQRAFLAQRGLAEWMKRAYGLADEAVAYWRAYETTNAFGLDDPWDLAGYLAVDGSAQHALRTSFRDCLDLYGRMRQAWHEIATGAYATPDLQWSSARPVTLLDPKAPPLRFEELTEDLSSFTLELPQAGETTFGYVMSGKCPPAALREFFLDFLYLDATRSIAGQYSRIFDDRAFPAVAQAFATESGYFLTRCHMEIWADFLESEFGVTREELVNYVPGAETRGSRFVTSWFLLHCGPEEALAGFHLGAPPEARKKMAGGATGLGMGGARAGPLETLAAQLSAALKKHYGIETDLARYFFVLHEEIEPFEQGEGWELVERCVVSRRQQEIFRRAFVTKVLSERNKDATTLARLKAWSES